MHRRVLFLSALTLAAVGVAASAYGSLAGSGPRMGPPTTISLWGAQIRFLLQIGAFSRQTRVLAPHTM